MKRAVSLFLAVLLVCLLASPCLAAVGSGDEVVSPRSADVTRITLEIDSNGKASAIVNCIGASDVTKIKVVVFFKERFGNIWERVDIKIVDNQIVYSQDGRVFSRTFKATMPDKGKTYCVVMEATYYGTTTRSETVWTTADYD